MDSRNHNPKAPLAIIILCGGTALAMIMYHFGASAFARWFIYPSLFFFSFALFRFLSPKSSKLDIRIWTACQWWSGIWLLWFLLGFCAVPFSVFLWIPLAGMTGGAANPFLALALHLLIWACATDLIKHPTSAALPADH